MVSSRQEKPFTMYFINSYCLFYSRLNFTSSSWRIIDLVSPKLFIILQAATKDVKDEMKIKLHMDGDVNGYKFKIEGSGQGKPYE